MFGDRARISRLERHVADQALAITVIADRVERSYRRPDLSKPVTLTLRPLSEMTDAAVAQGVRQLLEKDWFDVCLFGELARLARVYVPVELERHLKPLHCVRWSAMDPEYREQIQAHIVATFVPVEAGAGETAIVKGGT